MVCLNAQEMIVDKIQKRDICKKKTTTTDSTINSCASLVCGLLKVAAIYLNVEIEL